jgi:serine/threonine protein kinase
LKPDNILYSSLGEDGYLFQLADFGLANHRSLATTFCGTGYFQAPELWPRMSNLCSLFPFAGPRGPPWPLVAPETSRAFVSRCSRCHD